MLYFISSDHTSLIISRKCMKNCTNSPKFVKNAQNARSGPWWDRTRPKLGLETTTIVFSIQIGFRNRTNLLLILKSRFCWTQLICGVLVDALENCCSHFKLILCCFWFIISSIPNFIMKFSMLVGFGWSG